jgi:hypothetical protein
MRRGITGSEVSLYFYDPAGTQASFCSPEQHFSQQIGRNHARIACIK